MISKELLSEVLGYKVDTFLGINKNEIDYTCCKDENEGYIDTSINIYELAFKCKEWAISKGYDILSGGLEASLYSCYIDYNDKRYTLQMAPLHHEFANTEPEAIFAACDYILKELSNTLKKD